MWFVSKKKYDEAKAQLAKATNDRDRAEFELQFMKTKHQEELADYKDMIEQNTGMKLRILALDTALTTCQSRLELLTTKKEP